MDVMENTEKSVEAKAEKRVSMRDLKWASYIPMAICLIMIGWLFEPIFRSWYAEWMKEESYYSHGILVPFISLFVIWLKWKEIREIAVEPYAPGYIMLVPLLFVVVLLLWVGSKIAGGLTFPFIIGTSVLILFGRRIARTLAFPVGYLFFMCVLPGFILHILSFRIQMISTIGGTMILRALTFEAQRDGAMISLPNIDVMVGAPCSGFRLLISLFAFASLFAYLKEGPSWGKAVLIASTVPLSLIVNSIRISLIAIVGEFFGEDAMHAFHDYSGYLVLVLAFIILSLIARFVKCRKFNYMLTSS